MLLEIPKLPTNITLIAVTKNVSYQTILNLPDTVTHIAESKIQEAVDKLNELKQHSTKKFTTHFIGHLQSNKAAKAVQYFDYIQSVDSIKIANKINTEAYKINKIQKILLQINICNDPKKYGFNAKDINLVVNQISNLQNLEISGFMTILQDYDNPKNIKKYFSKMQSLFTKTNNTIMGTKPMKYLSMGMSQDYKEAIEEGSNMVRIGSLIFK